MINLSLKQTTPMVIWFGWDWVWKDFGGGGELSVFTLRYKQEKINSTITHRTGLMLVERISSMRPNTPVFLHQALSNIKIESHGSL